jgi:membrane protease YdiL (CAAX protease family)
LTLLAGGIWSAVFLRRPNVWALGIAHGILAALAYPLLLEDNPLKRL